MTDKKEQEIQKQIRDYMRKKDYYQILGVSKTASDTEIKKAYRTLALRFHPDKNQAEGSKEVFKKVSNSYSTLIDPDKRRHYDQFGPEQDRPRPQYRQAGRPGQDFEYQHFENIFEAFFGGGINRHHRQHHGHRQNFRAYQFNNFNRGAQQQQEGGFSFFYILIIFFVIYTLAPLFKSSPNYSSTPTYDHRIKRTTSKLNVEYFVNNNFMHEAKDYQYLRKAEMEIDRQFLIQLEQKCEFIKNQKRTLQIYAYQHREGRQRQNYLNRAKNLDTTSCRYLQQLSSTHQDYIRQITYMRY